MVITITVTYTTKIAVQREAGLAGRTFVDDDIEGVIRGTELIINNFTSKTIAVPWISTDEEWGIITEACRIGSAGTLMQRFPSLVAQGKAKVDQMYTMLNSFVYGDSGSGGEGGIKGDVISIAGMYELPDFEDMTNTDANANDTIGS